MAEADMQDITADGRVVSAHANERYRHYLTELLVSYVTDNGSLEPTPAYRKVMRVTGKTYGTVKNWLQYKVNLPDVESLARIANHWQIPPEQLLPAHLASLIGASDDPAYPTPLNVNGLMSRSDQLPLSLYSPANPTNVDKALAAYTQNPKATLFLRQSGTEMQDAIRAGELMLLDASMENIVSSGIYLLKLTAPDGSETTLVRRVEMLLGQGVVNLSCANSSVGSNVEAVALRNGALPSHITVLAKVVAVLKQI